MTSNLNSDLDSKRRRRRHRSQTARRYSFIGIVAIALLSIISGVGFGVHALFVHSSSVLVKDVSVTAIDAQAVPDTTAQTQASTPETPDEPPVITTYTVHSGDTISEIAEKFHVSTNTIRWANDIPLKGAIKVGEDLVILPFSGIEYTVKKGDTLSGIVAKYNGDTKEIMDVNGLESEKDIKPGDTILIPDGEMPTITTTKAVPAKTPSKSNATTSSGSSGVTSSSKSSGYFVMPIPGAVMTQGLHDGGAVDFGAPIGTNVLAAASGTVIIAKQGGNNGGYGSYIVINHSNGTQTLYGHLSKVLVSVGDHVSQGQHIGESGNTGESTGPHLHFKVTGTSNPFARVSIGTRY